MVMPQNKTKKDIARIVAEEIGITQLQSKLVVQKTFDTIVDILRENGRIELRNFGVFECKTRKARIGRNPKTDEEVYVPEKVVVTFKPGKKMGIAVRGSVANIKSRHTAAGKSTQTISEST